MLFGVDTQWNILFIKAWKQSKYALLSDIVLAMLFLGMTAIQKLI